MLIKNIIIKIISWRNILLGADNEDNSVNYLKNLINF